MKKKLLNSMRVLLVAAGLCVGASAWATTGDVTTNAKFVFSSEKTDFTNSASNYSDTEENGGVGTIAITSWGGTTKVSDGFFYLGNAQGVVTIPEEYRAGYGHDDNRDVVTIKFDLAIGNLSDKQVRFYVKDASGTNIAALEYIRFVSKKSRFGLNTFGLADNEEVMSGTGNAGTADKAVSWTLTFDYKAGVMSCKNSLMSEARTVPLENSNPVASFTISSNHDNTGRYSYFDNLIIQTTEGDYNAKTADYKIKFVCNGVEVKDAITRNGDVGASISLYASDMANFFNADESKRYIYVSNDSEGKTVSGEETTVVTITVREAEKWNYNVTSSYTIEETKNTLDWSAIGWVWEDLNTATISYPRYQVYETTLVGRAPVSNNLQKVITIANNEYTEDIAYTSEGITNIYLLKEAETLGVGTESTTSFTTRVSGGKIVYGASGTLMTLPAGKYIFTVGAIGGENSDGKKNEIIVKAGETTIATGTCTSNMLQLYTGSEFALTGTTSITFTMSAPNSNRGIDLVYVQKTGEVELPANVSVTLGKNGYTTFACEYDLDLSNLSGFKAYTASLSGVELSFAECTDKVVAGTGLLLKGTADAEVTIPVVATGAAAVADNALTGVTAATALQSNAEGNYIFVMKKAATASDELTFLPLTTESKVTVPAGKAYVSVPASAFAGGARALSVSFGEETTGINNVATTLQLESVYNLSGQRVMQPTKGLYIVNGKKVIVNK